MVAYIRELAVTQKAWLTDEAFKNGVALCQSIPGATAMQTAAYVGLRLKGVRGALSAYVGFGLPAFGLMVALACLYQHGAGLQAVGSVLRGWQMVVIALVANAAFSFGRSSLTDWRDCFLALSAAAALGFGVNPAWVVGGAAAAGVGLRRTAVPAVLPGETSPPAVKPGQAGSLSYVGAAFLFAFIVAGGLTILFFTSRRLCDLALVMLKVDFLAFGGGYASVPLMLHEVCETRGWLDTKTFTDGIALGQVTPGPIVITATFIGYQIASLPGALVSTGAVFSPSLFVLLLTEPYFDRLQRSAVFCLAVRGILASFVGLLLFAMCRLSGAAPWTAGTTILAVVAFTALRFRISMLWVVLGGALAAIVLGLGT